MSLEPLAAYLATFAELYGPPTPATFQCPECHRPIPFWPPDLGDRLNLECPGCGLFQIVPALGADMRSNCVRCGTVLRLTRADPLNRHLALTFAALVLFAVLWLAMLMKVSTAGIVHETTLESGPIELVNRGLWPLALAVAFTTAIAPVIKFAGTIYVLIGLKMRWLPPNLRGVFLVARRVGTWAMLEVLLLGVFVAYTKLGDLVTIELGPAVYALGLLTIVIVWAETAFDPHAV